MDKIKFSDIKRTHSLIQWIIPFQSWVQFTAFCFLIGFVMALVVVIVLNFTPDAHIGIYAWLIFAAFPGLHAALPGRLEINTENHFHTNKILTGLEELVRQFGYVPLKSSSKELRYRGKWPEWLTWEKNGVTISKVENGIVILGPIFTLKFIKKRFDDKMQGLS